MYCLDDCRIGDCLTWFLYFWSIFSLDIQCTSNSSSLACKFVFFMSVSCFAISSNCWLSFSLSLQLLLICLDQVKRGLQLQQELSTLYLLPVFLAVWTFYIFSPPSPSHLLLLIMALCGLAWYFWPPNEALNQVGRLGSGHSLNLLLCLNVYKATLVVDRSHQWGFYTFSRTCRFMSLFDLYLK